MLNRRLDVLVERDNNNFGVVRLIAAILVLLSHSYVIVFQDLTADHYENWSYFPVAAHAVHIFFILSGFVIAASWHRKPDWLHFFIGRALRISPLLILTASSIIVICAFIQQKLGFWEFIVSFDSAKFFFKSAISMSGHGVLPGILEASTLDRLIMPTVWTVRYEIICYLTMPVLGYLFYRISWMKLLPVITVAIFAVYLVLAHKPYSDFDSIDHIVRFFFTFYLGVCAWIYRHILSVRTVVFAMGFCVAFLFDWGRFSSVIEILAVGYLAFFLGSLNFGKFGKWVDRNDLSYGIYIMGYPIQLAWFSIGIGSTVSTNFVLSLTTAALLAFISWNWVEQPSLHQRKNLYVIASGVMNWMKRKMF